MDGFEHTRSSAATLHSTLVSAGVDPLAPLALVEGAVRHLDLELVSLDADDPALKGAHALFDNQSGTIYCAKRGDAVELALLASHEIGHAILHATSADCNVTDIDPSRSTEAAPVGLQRVEDYGAHERRELQANVFAREFLMPRSLAFTLHVEQSLGTIEIANRTGLPATLVRQQLFDALLLPYQVERQQPQSPNVSPIPDPSQTRAATHRGSPFQLQAAPGTGKTRTLVERVLSLLSENVDPDAVLVLTFSNRAAGELTERITAVAPEAASRIWIGTFHAFGLDLLRRFHEHFGISSRPTLFDRSDAIEVLQEILPTLPLVHYRNLWDPAIVLREIVAAISRAKDECATPERYRALSQNMLSQAVDEPTRIAAAKCLEIASVYDLYEAALRSRDAVDFGDLILRPTLLLQAKPELKITVQMRHRHVLVDEFQDVNYASGRMLKSIAGEGHRLWVVGDARQSIYRFRGASSTSMVDFARDYDDVAVDQLSVNYRSTDQIVQALVAISPNMGASAGMLPLRFSSARGRGPAAIQVRRYESLDDEAAGVAASVKELEGLGVHLRDQAVLCRSNPRLNEIATALEAHGIPVMYLGSIFERDEIRDLLALLSLIVDPFATGLVRVGAMPRYSLSLQDVYIVTQHCREERLQPHEALPELAQTKGLSDAGRSGLARLAADLAGLSPWTSPWEFLSTYLLDRTDLARTAAANGAVRDRMRAVALWQFLNFVRDERPAGTGPPIRLLLERVRQLTLLAEERDLRQVPSSALDLNAVRLMTIHGSKGLEFEAVHIPGLTVSSFPASNRSERCPPPAGMLHDQNSALASEESKREHDDEEQSLFFVALSRARTHLRLSLARFLPNGNKRSPSPFVSWMPSSMISEVAVPSAVRAAGGADSARRITVNRKGDLEVDLSSLASYERCPRRYFYTHVLGLGSGRTATAFSRTHDCVYDWMRWLRRVRLDAAPTTEEAELAFEEIWQSRGPVDHAFAGDYRQLASRIIASLVRSGINRKFREAQPLAVHFPNGSVVVEPDELTENAGGGVVLRRVRTGHKRSEEYDRLDYALYHLVGQEHFRGRFGVEAHHLTDDRVEPVEITPRKLGNRKTKTQGLLEGIRTGQFDTNADSVGCPRCPHFFICAAVPRGVLALD